jgi:hypothetical protein
MAQTTRPGAYRWIQWALVVVGALLAIGSIFADPLGFTWGGDGYGWKQMLATIAGLVIALGGLGLLMRPQTPQRRRRQELGFWVLGFRIVGAACHLPASPNPSVPSPL